MKEMIFSEWFREALKKSRLSGAELAERTKVSKQAVYCYLGGSRIPGPDAVVKLCAGLRIDPSTVPAFERRALGKLAHRSHANVR